MQYTPKEARELAYKNTFAIYDVFKNYFGEENVDLQDVNSEDYFKINLTKFGTPLDNGAYEVDDKDKAYVLSYYRNSRIIVHWPELTVTNEFDKSIKIWDLYAAVDLNYKSTLACSFNLNRTTYNKAQFATHYRHSHLPRFYNSPVSWDDPCLGYGPIEGTQKTLKDFPFSEEMLITWMLFCNELDNYVRVESLKGGPYVRLEEVLSSKPTQKEETSLEYPEYPLPQTFSREFIKYYLNRNTFRFSFVESQYTLGMSYYEYMLDISNAFIDYYNEDPQKVQEQLNLSKRAIATVFLRDASLQQGIVYCSSQQMALDSTTTNPDFSFKGQPVALKIIDDEEEQRMPLILRRDIALSLLQIILKTLNYYYGNTETTDYIASTGESVYFGR